MSTTTNMYHLLNEIYRRDGETEPQRQPASEGVTLVPLNKDTWPPVISRIVMFIVVAVFLGLRIWSQRLQRRLLALENILLYFAVFFYYILEALVLAQILIAWGMTSNLVTYVEGWKVSKLLSHIG